MLFPIPISYFLVRSLSPIFDTHKCELVLYFSLAPSPAAGISPMIPGHYGFDISSRTRSLELAEIRLPHCRIEFVEQGYA